MTPTEQAQSIVRTLDEIVECANELKAEFQTLISKDLSDEVITEEYADLLNEYVDDLTGNSCHLSLSLAVGEMRDLVDELLEERSK